MDFAVGPQGHIGLFAHQSNQVVEIDDCLISKGEMDIPHLAKKKWNGRDRVEVAASSTGEVNLSRAGRSLSGPSQLTEKVNLGEGKELRYTISPQSFWQSHINAPKALATKVLQLLQPTEGEVICDLYGGVGLFALALASEVGETGKVHLVESSKVAIADATRIFKSEKSVHIHNGMVESVLPRLKDIDAILLDPPRTGAGEQVVRAMAQANPRVIVYVSCDPASLARDAKSLALQGYRLESLTGFDLFPHTHHVECVARFIPA
jgi:tRNA/tmRNA/rRNA uracil-C5-methylase (TrmA/RlmC/RlmD family)